MDYLIHPWIPIAVLFVYEQDVSSDRLLHALSVLLNHYPPLIGRLDQSMAKPAISLTGETGAKLIEATCDATLQDYRDPDGRLHQGSLPDGSVDFLAPFEFNGAFVHKTPLLTVQLTKLACGACVIGIRTLHTLCAASGYFQLTGHLAELYRNLGLGQLDGQLGSPPLIQPYMADWSPSPGDQRISDAFVPHLLTTNESPVPAESTTAAKTAQAPVTVTGREIRFTAAKLASLKRDASGIAPGSSWISTFDAVCALMWQSVYRARSTYYGELDVPLSFPDFLTPINYASNQRLSQLPANYFGNALFCAVTGAQPDELLDATLSEVAAKVHELVQDMPGAHETLQTIEWIATRPDPSRIRTHFRQGNASLMISSWAKINVYESMRLGDHSYMEPLAVINPFTPISLIDGLGYILPESGNNNGLVLSLALNDALWPYVEREIAHYAVLV